MDDSPAWRAAARYKPGVLRVLYIVGLSGLADALSVNSRDRAVPDYVKESVGYFDDMVQHATSEGRLPDAQAAEIALGDVFAWVPQLDVAGAAARGREALRQRVLTQQAARRRRDVGSDSGIAYFDDLLDHTITLLVRAAERGAWPELVSLATGREILDNLDGVRTDIAWLTDAAGRTPPLDSAAAATAVSRAAVKAREEVRPEILPPMDRIAALTGMLGDTERVAFPLVVLGEGGLGKSVLAGQLFDQYQAERPTLLILCNHLPASADLTSADRIDAALGGLGAGLQVGLHELLTGYGRRPLVIIDTIDLLLRDETVDDIVVVLKTTADLADLVITCREREWTDLVEPTWRPQTWPLPTLTKPEVSALAERFASTTEIPASAATAFLTSLNVVLDRRRALDVLGVPLRLAMACALYAADGRMPDDLTVTQLYQQYWDRRVHSDRKGRVTVRSRQKEGTALDVAANVWRESQTRFVEDVPRPNAAQADQLLELLSEGVVKEAGLRVSFFHQTFAEFAVAKHLAGYGADADWTRLGDGLSVGRSGYWGVATHLLTEKLSPERLAAVAAAIPRNSVEGARLLVRLAFTASFDFILTELLDHHPEMLAAAADVLGDAPEPQINVATEALLKLLAVTSTNLSQIRGSLAELIRTRPDADAKLLVSSLSTLTTRSAPDLSVIANEVVKLLTTVFKAGFRADLLLDVVDTYATLPQAGQACLIRLVNEAGRPELDTALLDVALQHPRPEAVRDECVAIMIRQWSDETVRRVRGWTTWRETLTATYPIGWEGCQVHLVRALAGADETVVAELLNEALHPSAPGLSQRGRVTGIARLIAEDDPAVVAAALLRGFSPTREAVGVASQLVRHAEPVLTKAQCFELADRLVAVASLEPRLTWPAVIKLSAHDHPALAQRLQELAEAARSAQAEDTHWPLVAEGAVDALLYAATPADLARHLDGIEAVVASCGIPPKCEARLRAAFAVVSKDARDWVDEVVDGAKLRARGYAVSAVIDRVDDWPAADWDSTGLDWFVQLLRVQREGAVPKLAQRLKVDAAGPSWRRVHTEAAHARLVQALERDEDPQTAGSLLAVLAEVAHRRSDARSVGPTAADVEPILAAYERALDRAMQPDSKRAVGHLPAIYAATCAALTDVAKAVLSATDVIARTLVLLKTVDTGVIGTVASGNLAQLLISVVRTSPDAWLIFEAAWPEASESNKRALAECALYGAVPNGHQVALRLARRKDCPRSVYAYVLRITQ